MAITAVSVRQGCEMQRATTLSQLARRIDRQSELQRGIRLSAEELDLLIAAGAYDCLMKAAVAERRALAESRVEQKRPGTLT